MGREKGQVENQAGTVRQRFFAPRVRARSYEELNAWLLDRCIAWARAQPHPEIRDRTIWEMFETERPSLVPYRGSFDGFHALTASVSKTCLVRFDNNKYSVSAAAEGWADGARRVAGARVRIGRGPARSRGCGGRGRAVGRRVVPRRLVVPILQEAVRAGALGAAPLAGAHARLELADDRRGS